MKKILVEICAGTSCYLLGSQDLIDAVETLPREQRKQVDSSGVTCLNSCGKGPNVRVNGVVLRNMTPERLLQILQDNF